MLQAARQDVKANLFLSQGRDGGNFRSSIYCAGITGIRQASNVHKRAQSLTRAALKSALIVMPRAVRGDFTSVELNNAIINLSIFLRALNYASFFRL